MKTRSYMAAITMGLAFTAALTGGCGAKTVGITETEVVAVASAEEPAPTPATAAGVEAPAPEAPPGMEGAVVQKSEAAAPPLRPELAEVVALVHSGASEEVVRTFVSVSDVGYDLSLEEIIYLRDVGIPDSVIAAMMRRGGELRDQQAEAEAMQTNLLSTVEHLKDALAAGTPETEPAAGASELGTAAAETAAVSEPAATAVTGPQAPADAPETVQQFYSDLTPYGTWYQVPTYGWVWRPSVVVVDSGWMPYRHGGRWLWTNSGWYWCSDYSWGWAPFHYGRWCTYPGLGWCWQPGSVWGPSWVTWRHHGSYVGWAPLPPACGWSSGVGLTWHGSGVSVGFSFGLSSSWYTFVPNRSFCYRNVGHHAISGRRVNDVYRDSTVINNVIVGDNNTIVNNGMGYEKIASRVRGEVPKATVHPLPPQADKPLRADRMERSKDGYVVFRPTRTEAAAGRPATLRSEVRPAGAAPSLVARGSAPTSPSRPAYGSRFGSTSATSSVGGEKPVEGRGSSTAPSAAGIRPVAPTGRTWTTPTPRNASRTGAGTTATKPANTRVASPDSGRLGASSPSDSVLSPRRQTLPVPLGDPSRNIPSRSASPSTTSRPAPTTVTPSKPAGDTRSQRTYTAPAVQGRSYSIPQRSSVPQRSVPAPSAVRPVSPSYSVPSRNPTPARAMPVAPTAPRQSFSAPAPNFSAPRPSFSAPAPAVSAPRPAVSAPAPAVSSPRPSSSTAAPSAGAPGRSSSPGGRRTQAD